jgi:SAM-dependent methyltransferase
VGFDVDQEFLRIGTSVFGLEMRYGFVEEALEEVGRADLVVLSHVVEHFASPETLLAAIARRLRSNALVLIEVPGIFRLHRTNLDVRSYLQNAHTFTYCGFTLRDVCVRAGLEVLEVDEIARVVCRPTSRPPVTQAPVRPELAARIIRYLRLCDQGFRWYQRLLRLPFFGRASARVWKWTYFASLGTLVSRPDRPSRRAIRLLASRAATRSSSRARREPSR